MRRQPDEIDEAVYEYGKLVSRKSTGCRPNPHKKWLRKHPKGSLVRIQWEEKKAMRERLRYLLDSEE